MHFALNICRLNFFNIRAFGLVGLRKWNIQAVAVTRSLPLSRLKRNDGKKWSSFLVSRVRPLSQKEKRKRKKTQNISQNLPVWESQNEHNRWLFLNSCSRHKSRENSRTREKRCELLKHNSWGFMKECEKYNKILLRSN